jgi:hypothetical protein
MYANAKIIPVETVPGIRGVGMIERSGGDEFKYDILIYCKNLPKCYRVLPSSITIIIIIKKQTCMFHKGLYDRPW